MNVTSGTLAIIMGIAAAVSVDFTAKTINPTPGALVVEELHYSDGKFTQTVSPSSGDGIPARWAAEIFRVTNGATKQLCAGSGQGIYTGKTDIYNADDWTGDTCPELRSGDIAEAAWSYTDADGLTRTIIAELTL